MGVCMAPYPVAHMGGMRCNWTANLAALQHWAAVLGKNELLRLVLETGMYKQELRGCGRVLDLRCE